MEKINVTVKNESGLHARPASLFVKEAGKFESEIFIVKDDKEVNGKSIMGVMSLGAKSGTELTIKAEGSDAKEALEALEQLIKSNFGE
ncbi:HPr family phosphocarrier protein [Proteinivorax hydrogeniformans]|uniref:Phosphocarrier protein HPr n=1 Tax=Proteinivorax hydrogeniformans TaxID=1826727 RepID=A0AAU8HT91_9FIRM